MARPAWTYRDAGSYGLNSYGKPALVLQTLGGAARRGGDGARAAHLRAALPLRPPDHGGLHRHGERGDGPGLAVVLRPDVLLERAVRLRGRASSTQPARVPAGWFEAQDGRLELRPPRPTPTLAPREAQASTRESPSCGTARCGCPSSCGVEFARDGRASTRQWDGRDRWKRFEYPGRRVVRAVVDPAHKLAIDVDPVNNEWIAERRSRARGRRRSGPRATCSGCRPSSR